MVGGALGSPVVGFEGLAGWGWCGWGRGVCAALARSAGGAVVAVAACVFGAGPLGAVGGVAEVPCGVGWDGAGGFEAACCVAGGEACLDAWAPAFAFGLVVAAGAIRTLAGWWFPGGARAVTSRVAASG